MVIPLPHYFISDHDWARAQKCLSCVVFPAITLPYSFTNS